MKGTVISIRYQPDFEAACRSLRINEEFQDDFQVIYEACVSVANPKATFSLQQVSQDAQNTVIGDSCFSSSIMYRNFTGIHRAFAYAATCGRELYGLYHATHDDLERWWIDQFSMDAMRAVLSEMTVALQKQYGIGQTASMNPGSLPNFPISCQKDLFHLLEEETAQIDIELTSSYLMLPHKSVSGFLYETKSGFVNCQLCPRPNCPGRRAQYDAQRVKEYGLEQ